jgi:catechol 2,3-dioxygenase-like lactoylglutathione lyase family enzyme
MHRIADDLIKEVEEGRLGRREAVARLVALAAAAFAVPTGSPAAAGAESPTFQAVGLDHIALDITDLDRSREFYQKHLGLALRSQSSQSVFLDVGSDNFVALFRSGTARMNHYAYTIDDYDAGEVVKRLSGAGLEPRREDNRVYFPDPDGLTVQISGR